MSIAKLSPASLALVNDRIWAASGSLGSLILLKGDLFTGSFTVDASTDIITTTAPHGMVTGSRLRVSTSGVLPALATGSLNTAVDYYAIALTSSTLQLALTLVDAQAGTYLNFIDTGSGTHTLTEQRLTESDPISVLINKELSHPDYSRYDVGGVGAAGAVGSYGEKPPQAYTYYASSSDMVFRHALFLRGATLTIADTTGTEPQITTESSDVTVTPGTPKIITLVLRTRNV